MGSRDQSDAYDFLIDARIFLEAGDKLKSDDFAFHGPQLALYAHSIELSFKALLRHNGMSIDELKRKFSHNLKKLYENCKPHKLKSNDADFEPVILLLHDSHKSSSRSFYYPEKEFVFPIPSRCARIARLLFEEIKAMCGPDPLMPKRL